MHRCYIEPFDVIGGSMEHLSGSVGLAGVNRAIDVRLAQRKLLEAGVSPGPIDGKCGRRTCSAIVAFQRRVLASPDGLIEQHGSTWRHLLQATRPDHAQSAHAAKAIVELPPLATAVASTTAVPVLDYRQALPLPPRHSLNLDLHSPPNQLMRAKFGEPRADYDQECRPPTNPRIAAALTMGHVGKTRVTGLRPAVESLQQIMREIENELPDLYPHLGSAGMMCCRETRGRNAVSNHSWGTAIDIKIDGSAEPYGQHYVYIGLSLIAPIFNRHGWYWGASFPTPDPHHFECGLAMVANFAI